MLKLPLERRLMTPRLVILRQVTFGFVSKSMFGGLGSLVAQCNLLIRGRS